MCIQYIYISSTLLEVRARPDLVARLDTLTPSVNRVSELVRHMRHQELWRAVETHYGPTRIYGPTGHAIGGMAQQALRSFYRR